MNSNTENKANNPTFGKPVLYVSLAQFPFDLYGPHLAITGWIPSESDEEFMGKESYILAKEEGEELNAKALFSNVFLDWDSCDCGDGYGCSHGSFVYQIRVDSEGEVVELELEEDTIYFNHKGVGSMPLKSATVFDFYRMCELTGIKLELTDYGKTFI